MDAKQVLEQVRSGAISVEDAEQFFRRAPYEELGYAKLDTHRKLRSGFGEVVFCSGKADEFLSSIFEKLAAEDGEVLGTRATPHQFELVKAVCPSAVYDSIARIIKVEARQLRSGRGGHGGGTGQRHRRAGAEPGHCCAYLGGVRGQLRRAFRTADDDQLLRQRHCHRQHR